MFSEGIWGQLRRVAFLVGRVKGVARIVGAVPRVFCSRGSDSFRLTYS